MADSVRERCIHYTGLIGGNSLDGLARNVRCEAGVAYSDVSPDGRDFTVKSLPCFKRNGLPCPHQHFRTDEEAEEYLRQTNAAGARYLELLASDRCPVCETPVKTYLQVGRCVYGEPCGHRLYQGKAPKGGSFADG